MKLDVWLESHETKVGTLERADSKALTFTYAADASRSAQISISLPVRSEPYSDGACRGYFDNLVFEGPQLDRLLASYSLDRNDTGGLLYHLGADCPGAISITPEGRGPAKRPGAFPDDYEQLGDEALLRIVLSLHIDQRLPEDKRDPSPLAGVQGKIAVVFRDEQYYVPKPGLGAPTSHILKVSPQNDIDLTRYEAALLSIATTAGIPTTLFQEKVFADGPLTIHTLLVARFDRRVEGNAIHRVHTEDFCQALGLPPSLKYERNSISSVHAFNAIAIGRLARDMAVPATFVGGILDQTLFNLLVGNTDNHGKNGSILFKGRAPELAPLYDVVPVFMDPRVTHQFAFSIGKAHFAEDLTQADLIAMMRDFGYQRTRLDQLLSSKLRLFVKTIIEQTDKPGRKALADALAEQMSVVINSLKLDLEVPIRDYYGRVARDEKANTAAWTITS